MNARERILIAFIVGLLMTYVLKYVIFGLEQWDKALHPERLVADTTGPYRRFSKPLLGGFFQS